MLDTWHSVRIHVSTHVNQWARVKVWTWLKGPLVWHEASVQGNIGISSAILTTIGNSKERTASGSQRGVCWQVLGNWESSRHIWIVYAFSSVKEKGMLGRTECMPSVFSTCWIVVETGWTCTATCTPPIHCVCIESVFRSPANRKKSRDRKRRPWNELCPICPYWSCFRTFIVLRCSHLSPCWSILSWPESWLSASICGISDKSHGVTLESACFEQRKSETERSESV
jgi:hypothetical protein